MIEKSINDSIAISSLESPTHATRKDPKIVSITWFIGKRCNYDCSYCSSYTHDNFSPHIIKQDAFNFIDQLEEQTVKQNKKFKMSITGGEPFVHPDFLEILAYIKKKQSLTQLVVVSNGSLPTKIYTKSSEHISNLTISLHLEQDDKIIDDTVDKIVELSKVNKWMLNVNLMAFPKKLEKIKNIIKIFEDNSVKFVLRKIDPPYEDPTLIPRKNNLEDNYQEDEGIYMTTKLLKKITSIEQLEDRHKAYYGQEELTFIENFANNTWQNIKIHNEHSHIESNTDELKSKNLNNWKNWKCFIGIDSLYIQHNGLVYRGNCMQGESLGRLGGPIKWPTVPITCPLDKCMCNGDMVVRKYKNNKGKEKIV